MRTPASLLGLSVLLTILFTTSPFAMQSSKGGADVSLARETPLTRDVTIISSAGARALADACTAWADKNKLVVAMAVIDWGGNLIEFHAMEGAAANAIETAILKAKSALRWRRPTSETNKMVRSGENLAPTFMDDFPQPGAVPIVLKGEVIGAMGVSSGDGERCAQAAIDAVFKGQATTVGR
jgi:glc operon protein GlcG